MVWSFIPLPDREPEDARVPVSDATLALFSVTSNYPYRPLNPATETRLLSIKPGSYDDDLFCSLFHAPHASHEDYEALSYVWANAISSWGSKALDVQTKAVIYGEGKENEPVETITFRDLPEHPYYERLYHGSGGPRRPGHIIIDGVEVAVGGELFIALKRLRSASEPLVLWVDALCINQTDSVERVEHVKEMGGIYARAKSVRIWLGEEVGYEDSAFEALNTIAEKIGDLHRDGVPHDLQQLTFLRDEKIRGLHWDSVSELLGRTWFERVWVIQEVANAKEATIQVGRIIWSWDAFASIIKALRFMDIDLYLWSRGELKANDSVILMDRLRTATVGESPPPRPSLLDILRASRTSECTFASDKIYGVLGLASDPDCIEVDYSLDPSEIYHRLVTIYLQDRHSLDILYCCAKSARKSDLNLPSWIPDWTKPCYHEPFIFRDFPSRAAGDSQIQLTFLNGDEKHDKLFIRGKILDTISAVEKIRKIPRNNKPFYKEGLPMFESRHESWLEDTSETLRAWISNTIDIAFPDRSCTPQTYESLWRAFICNKTSEGKTPPPDWGQLFSDFVTSTTVALGSRQEAEMDEWGRPSSKMVFDLRDKARQTAKSNPFLVKIKGFTAFKEAHGTWCYNRRFFRSSTGRLGWVPDGAEPGDQICIFFGGAVPFVLRPDGEGAHEVVGDAYLHGIMDGEGMDDGIEEQEFCLI